MLNEFHKYITIIGLGVKNNIRKNV